MFDGWWLHRRIFSYFYHKSILALTELDKLAVNHNESLPPVTEI